MATTEVKAAAYIRHAPKDSNRTCGAIEVSPGHIAIEYLTYCEPSVDRLSWHITSHIAVQTRFIVGDEACLLSVRSNGRDTGQGFAEPSEDW